MCGIAGIVDLGRNRVDPEALAKICARMTHRGPDGHGTHVDGEVALGHRRLSIVDLAGGAQPMSNDDGSVWVTFNGEIYNFKELRRELTGLGHRFRTQGDTEIIIRAYEQFGGDCVRRFRGMFAFGIWDARLRQLFLARDHVGKKPLYHARAGGQLIFASELQALLEHPAIHRELEPGAIDDYLTYGYVPAPKTAFRGVYKLPPAHTLTLKLGDGDGLGPPDPRIEPYWRLDYSPKLNLNEDDAAEALLEVLTEAVRLRMVADVPVGALVSGGVDSSLIVALMSQLSDRPIQTFSIGFDEQPFNELPHARKVALHCRTDHQELIVRPDALNLLPTLVRHYGEPYADASAVATFEVARLTRQHVTVALSGDGGDECFAGYDRYLGDRLADWYQWVPRSVRALMIEPLVRLVPDCQRQGHRAGRARRFLLNASQAPEQRYLRWVSYFSQELKADLYSREFAGQLGEYDSTAWIVERLKALRRSGLKSADRLLAADVGSFLPEGLLVKMDIASMANSLEARSPFLDRRVMEFAARLPVNFKLRGTCLKYLLKKVARPLLPAGLLDRRKMGFGVPVGDWLRCQLRPLLDDLLLSPEARSRGYFQPDSVRRLVREHTGGTHNHGARLWALLWLELWHREFLI
jgi:asparagine synthase (glutamine-hydrolysing)